ncbi:Crp/Fnr family transcriptional regulator [Streptomyces sp. NPDC005263]|uniref:Crp/Fnr family transcriptional regulator n=1 Tax=Streptomyces sp. NPDC005263 TaxID=3364711 RepID=UPI00369C054D
MDAPRRNAGRGGGWPRGSFLGRLADAALQDLLALGRPRVFEAKEVLVRQGDVDRHALLLLSGFTKVTATVENGRESLLAIRLGGDIVGEMAAIADMPRTATVTACGRVRTRAVSHEALRAFLLRCPDAAVVMTGILSERLRWANNRRLEFRGYNVKERLARILVDLASIHGVQGREGVELGFSLTQPEMAALTGAAEPTVHKALKDLRDAKLIGTGYRTTTIRDLDRLRVEARLPAPDTW